MSAYLRLTRVRRACIARALEASEHPERIAGSAALTDSMDEVRAAIRAVRRIDPAGRSNRLLRDELERRLHRLAERHDAVVTEDRREVIAQVMAWSALGRAAGYAVHPLAPDLQRAPTPDGDLGSLAD